MKDKEMVEELSDLINKTLFIYLDKDDLSCKDVCNLLAEDILEHYQPKRSEDSVVLTKGEYELWNILKKTWASDDKEVSAEDMLETLKNTKELGSKETAKAFWYMTTTQIRDTVRPLQNEEDNSFANGVIQAQRRVLRILDETLKHFGAEIKES